MNYSIQRLRANLTAYVGPNFSGRTQALQDAVEARKGVALGGSAYSAISGLHDTVEGELRFYCKSETTKFRRMSDFAAEFGLTEIWSQNPFSGQCSGGQEAALVILCRLALGREIIGLDVCVEQLSLKARKFLYDSVIPAFPQTDVAIVDNRLRELFPNIERQSHAEIQPGQIDSKCLATGSKDTSLTVQNLSFSYLKNQPIFQHCTISFAPGIYVLRGPNGSGKSTFAKLLAGLLRQAGGRIEYGSQEIDPYRHPGRYVSYAFQDPNLQMFTTRVVDMIGSSIFGTVLMSAFGLASHVNKHPLDLPWVLRKRLSIAAALGRETPAVVLDEPTLGQDENFCNLLAAHLLALSRRGNIIIVISHSPNFAELLGAQVIDMSELRRQA